MHAQVQEHPQPHWHEFNADIRDTDIVPDDLASSIISPPIALFQTKVARLLNLKLYTYHQAIRFLVY
jgi:hypothetical protein